MTAERFRLVLAVVLVLGGVVLAVTTRYATLEAGESRVTIVLDRWTGDVCVTRWRGGGRYDPCQADEQ